MAMSTGRWPSPLLGPSRLARAVGESPALHSSRAILKSPRQTAQCSRVCPLLSESCTSAPPSTASFTSCHHRYKASGASDGWCKESMAPLRLVLILYVVFAP
eukprot:scaffold66054_cov60-Phaeocystis_antarctica.AAC.3